MPTGYTSAIADGIDFKTFAYSCARAFGALIMMRDDPKDAPIPDAFEPSKYHSEALQKAYDELNNLNKMTEQELGEAAKELFIQETDRNAKYRKEYGELRGKYNAMLDQVNAWQPPTKDHVGIKDFMVKQITESIDWDCNTSHLKEPVLMTSQQYKAMRLDKINWDIQYHLKEDAAEIERTNSRNAWIKAFKESFN